MKFVTNQVYIPSLQSFSLFKSKATQFELNKLLTVNTMSSKCDAFFVKDMVALYKSALQITQAIRNVTWKECKFIIYLLLHKFA